jgi:hypothetical protein
LGGAAELPHPNVLIDMTTAIAVEEKVRTGFISQSYFWQRFYFIPHPSSLIPHPSSLIPHPSSLIPHPFAIAIAQRDTDLKQHSDRTLDSCNSNTFVRATSSLHGCHISVVLSNLLEAVLRGVHEPEQQQRWQE